MDHQQQFTLVSIINLSNVISRTGIFNILHKSSPCDFTHEQSCVHRMPGSNKNVHFSKAVVLNAARSIPHMNNHAFTACPSAGKKNVNLSSDAALNAAFTNPNMNNHAFTACLAATKMFISPWPLP